MTPINEVKVDESTVKTMSEKETDPENLLKCSCEALVLAEDISKPNSGMDQPKIECKVANGQAQRLQRTVMAMKLKYLSSIAEDVIKRYMLVKPISYVYAYDNRNTIMKCKRSVKIQKLQLETTGARREAEEMKRKAQELKQEAESARAVAEEA
ncbi:hypothetical protein Fmac_027390 [Flemingia macrophylla]|uniref:Uncharacterized protein n=1 Tax=Flemingia macrophylla TaxID=520843 RepID=A0ABD1LHR2_9FABA